MLYKKFCCMDVVNFVIVYFSIGTFFGVLYLLALKKFDEKIETIDLFIAFATVFVWLLAISYYAADWIRYYRNLKKQEHEFWEKLIERALEKANEELEANGDK